MPISIYERLYRNDLPSFARFALNEISPDQDDVVGWPIDVMTDALQGCLDRGTTRLILNAPPRSLKSHCASVALVVFALGRDPTRKIIVVAGTRALAAELQRRVVALMRAPRCRALFPHLRPTVTPSEIVVPHGGSISYRAVGQSLIGRGADLIIIDDPIAPHGAQDDAARASVNAWYDAEVVPRLNDKCGGSIILVMQRVHQDDLTGHVRKRGTWTEVVLPAIALEDEAWPLYRRRTVTRRKGEPLMPDREGKEVLMAILRDIAAYNFWAQYLQRPSQVPGLYRTGLFFEPRPPDWHPSMGIGGCAFLTITEASCMIHEIFGVGDPLPYLTKSPYSDEEHEAASIIQQRRLVAEGKAYRERIEMHEMQSR